MKSGFITVLGRPNVGKSSLINALVGEKVSIVSPKAQTTRDRIMGVLTEDDCQMIFVDTPGVHKAETKLGEYMEKCVKGSTSDADAIVIVLDGSKKIFPSDLQFIEKYLKTTGIPVYLVINKDVGKYEAIYPLLNQVSYLTKPDGDRRAVEDIIPTSAKKKTNIDVLKAALKTKLTDGAAYFPEDEYTDKNERYIICETVREKALLLLSDEIPHGIGVYMQRMYYEGDIAHIILDIIVEKESHKPIVIGAGGEMLRAIGEAARKDIERLLDSKVYLETFVKVRDKWRDDKSVLTEIGYDLKSLK